MELNIPAAARKRVTDTDTVRWEGHAEIWVETREETRKVGQRGARDGGKSHSEKKKCLGAKC